MFRLEKRFAFEAAHRLDHHDGKCARLHGHSFVAVVRVKGPSLHASGPKTGMLLDYGDISAAVKPIVDEFLDHHFLNETLGMDSPTSERIAEWLYGRLLPVLPGLNAVTICETCTSEATFNE
jgi:6-pyruvoyltetrahydropterin/6-carboxytetrahydropterin synthase